MKYNTSIFVELLFDIIDSHNKKNYDKLDYETLLPYDDYFASISISLHQIKCDYVTYFKEFIYNSFFQNEFLIKAKRKKYNIDFDISKTILVHLRLGDVRHDPEYDGSICGNYFRNEIDNDKNINEDTNLELHKKYEYKKRYNHQAPLNKDILQKQIDIVSKKYPEYKIVVITNPGENTSYFPYETIQSTDESFDLFLLSQAEIVIMSKSTFPISSLFFGNQKDVYIPLWGHVPLFGLYTKYDKTHFNYF